MPAYGGWLGSKGSARSGVVGKAVGSLFARRIPRGFGPGRWLRRPRRAPVFPVPCIPVVFAPRGRGSGN